MMRTDRGDRGAALVTSLFITFALVASSITYVSLSYSGYEASGREIAGVRARLAADDGLHLAMAELKSGVDAGGDGLGTVLFTGPDGRVAAAAATDLGGNLFRLHARGEVPRARLGSDMIVQLIASESLGFPPRAAITAQGEVTTLGNIEVDGRDHDDTGSSVIGPGSFGISSMNGISVQGSSTTGGNGLPPTGDPGASIIEEFALWHDNIDNDGDGSVDEELFDGLDDDGDGLVDEDTSGYPESPDAMLGLPPGSLKAFAMARGTYFSSEAELDAYIDAHDDNIPGGQIIYADFDTWLPAQMGDQLNDPPSILIHHNPTGTALMKNVHGSFKGLILADYVEHLDGDMIVVGALMSFSDESYGNAFGNGNARVYLSSAVLGNLPSGSPTAKVRVHSWSRSAP
jgi:hypothetical protein